MSYELLSYSAVSLRWCSPCAGERWFEVPPCEDGHGADCIDLACVDCGAALVLGMLLGEPVEVIATPLAA